MPSDAKSIPDACSKGHPTRTHHARNPAILSRDDGILSISAVLYSQGVRLGDRNVGLLCSVEVIQGLVWNEAKVILKLPVLDEIIVSPSRFQSCRLPLYSAMFSRSLGRQAEVAESEYWMPFGAHRQEVLLAVAMRLLQSGRCRDIWCHRGGR